MSWRLVSRPEQLRVALDAVGERRREPRPQLDLRGAHVLGQDRRGGAVRGPDVLDHGVVAGALGVVVDHEIHRAQPRGRLVAEHRRLYVEQRQRIELAELVGGERAHVDVERVDHRAVLGPRDLAEGDQRRGRTLAPEQRAQRVAAGDAVGIGIGLEQDAELLARLHQRAQLHHAAQVVEVRELFFDVVADQRAQAGAQQTAIARQLLVVDAIGEQQHRRLGRRFAHGDERRAHEGGVFAHDREVVTGLEVELRDRLGGEAARQRVESRRTKAGLLVARHPAEHLVRAGADLPPQARVLRPITQDDATRQVPPELDRRRGGSWPWRGARTGGPV